jgi:hypothetical protein
MKDIRPLRFEWWSKSHVVSVWLIGTLMVMIACTQKPWAGRAGNGTVTSHDSAYQSRIEISHLNLAKGESYLGDSVYFVEGEIKNSGDRIVQRVELTLTFRDSLKQVVLKETRRALEYKTSKGLEVQKTAKFQIGFDHLPKDWNNFLPEVQVTGVVLR